MVPELKGVDIGGRLAVASKLVNKLEQLSVCLNQLCNKRFDPVGDLKSIESVNESVIASLRILEKCPQDYFTDDGPRISVSGFANPIFSLAHFKAGARKAKDSVEYFRRDYQRRGNSDWTKWKRELQDFRIARKDLAEFLQIMELLGYGQSEDCTTAILELNKVEPVVITYEQACFLKAALVAQADKYAADSSEIYRKASGGIECPRNLRESLIKAGLLTSVKGVGVMLTAKGTFVAKTQCEL